MNATSDRRTLCRDVAGTGSIDIDEKYLLTQSFAEYTLRRKYKVYFEENLDLVIDR